MRDDTYKVFEITCLSRIDRDSKPDSIKCSKINHAIDVAKRILQSSTSRKQEVWINIMTKPMLLYNTFLISFNPCMKQYQKVEPDQFWCATFLYKDFNIVDDRKSRERSK